jgi:hypothetical protein
MRNCNSFYPHRKWVHFGWSDLLFEPGLCFRFEKYWPVFTVVLTELGFLRVGGNFAIYRAPWKCPCCFLQLRRYVHYLHYREHVEGIHWLCQSGSLIMTVIF